jgi:hypothetical protein
MGSVALYKMSDNVYVQKAENIVFANFFFVGDHTNFYFARILLKTLFTARNIKPSMNDTSSCVPTAKSDFD